VPGSNIRSGWHLGFLAVTLSGAALAAAPPEAQIATGRIAGELMPEGVRVFRGIPFAAPPVGPLRWRDPQPPASWTGVRDATHFGPRCTQTAGNAQIRVADAGADLPISEDCLYLNVWTAAQRADERRPVIVWIHGGSFMIGSGAQRDGAALARRGVVLVSINYRLNAFGFYSHPAITAESAQPVSGNYGFADARAALEWVHKNVAAFGGDPRNVTVMGQSAGGRLIQSLRTSSCARGLFLRAIVESAPLRILPMRKLEDAERDGSAAAETVGAHSLTELRALTAQQVLENFPTGQPIIDGRCITHDALRAIDTGSSHDVDLLVGSNADEGTFPFLRARELSIAFDSAEKYSSYVQERFGDGAAAFLAAYPVGGDVDYNARHREAFRDEAAWLARFSALSHERSGKGHTYLYYFTHRPPARATGPDLGATHGAEIAYAYRLAAPGWRDEDRRLSDAMSAYWVNFATRGNPNGPGLAPWPEFTQKNSLRMNLGPMSAEPALDADRVAIFDALHRRVMDEDQRKGE
jgi:para-nitrobenzyl esterase